MVTMIRSNTETQESTACRHCSTLMVPYSDEDGDPRCMACDREWYPRLHTDEWAELSEQQNRVQKSREDELVHTVAQERERRAAQGNECWNGQRERFVHRTGEEIAELLEHCPLLAGEIDCSCIHTETHSRQGDHGNPAKCPTCGRIWTPRWDGSLQLKQKTCTR